MLPVITQRERRLSSQETDVEYVAWADAYFRTKWHLDPSSRLATIDMGRKSGARAEF